MPLDLAALVAPMIGAYRQFMDSWYKARQA